MKKLINSADTVLEESLDGLAAAHADILLLGAERAAFIEAYGRAHPGRLRAPHREAHTRTVTVTVPDLGDDKKNRALEQLVVDFAAQLARYAESVG